MIRYWDGTDRERGEMAEEEVRALLDVERMEKGLTRPRPPALRDVPDCEPETETFFRVAYGSTRYYGSREHFDAVFQTAEEARAFIETEPMKINDNWESGTKSAVRAEGCIVEAVEIATADEVNRLKSQLVEKKAATEANTKAQDAFDKESAEWDRGADAIWEDWADQRAAATRHQSVIDTWEEYLTLCECVETTASAFLGKAYSCEQIAQAFEWFGRPAPDAPASELHVGEVE